MPKNDPGAYSDPNSPHYVESAARRKQITQRAMKGPFSKGPRYGGTTRPTKRASVAKNRKATFKPTVPASEGRMYLSRGPHREPKPKLGPKGRKLMMTKGGGRRKKLPEWWTKHTGLDR